MENAPRTLAGRYEIGEVIGRGGMAEVHIGQDTRLGRTVAIKMLRSDLARDPAFQARFRREAQAAASLNHPAIVAVYDTGEDTYVDPAGVTQHAPFIIMEYIEGHTVRDILKGGQPVPIEEAVQITAGVLAALEYSHRAGIIHRDIKPANVMITPTGAIKVMDFGIARAMADSAQTMTQTQAVIGTAQYLSPEQARGESVDARSDLYSTGCLLYELLTGRPPFVGDSPVSVAYQHVREDAQPPSAFASDIPDPLDRIVMKSLAKDRNLRYGSAGEFRGDLEAFQAGRPVSAPPVGALAVDPDAATAIYSPVADATQIMGPTAAAAAAGAAVGAAAATPAWDTVVADAPGSVPPADEPPADEEEEKSKAWIWWTVGGVVAAAIIAVILMFTLRGDGEPTPAGTPTETIAMVEVPDVSDFNSADAQKAIEDAGLKFLAIPTPSDTIEKDKVVSQTPLGGVKAAKDSTVNVQISTGPTSVTVPDLSGKTQEEASAALTALGLQAGTVNAVESATVPEKNVISSDPAANTPVAPGTKVNLTISTGRITLPSYLGQDYKVAQKALQDMGFSVSLDPQENSSSQPNTVIDQNPGVGASVPQKSGVTLTYAVTPQSAQVPVVAGQTQSAATSILEEAGFVVEVVEEFSSAQVGVATRTDPPAGQYPPYGSTIKLYISKGPQPTTSPTPAAGGNGNGKNGNG